jgi:hypothetical protein
MTTQGPKKMHGSAVSLAARLVVALVGALEALLLARLVARLLAARPDNPAFALLERATWPFVAPLAALDSGQPPFGARLELSTLLMAMIVPIVGYALWALLARIPRTGGSVIGHEREAPRP